jgi:dihydroflavonol-4-reductase
MKGKPTMAHRLVTITGLTGFIAAHTTALLLERGYQVRGTLRSATKATQNPRLTALPGASERLELIEADLLDENAFDVAVSGAECVFHMASPYSLEFKDAQRDLVDPAVHGTLNVLQACAKAPAVKRVVLTSSMAAVTDEPDGRVLTEADWNTRSSLTRNPYYYSKSAAERAAWDFMEREKPAFDLVVINPFLVIGPSLTPELNTSNQIIVEALTGVFPAIMQLNWGMVDVRDVALAHVMAAENPAANGRYLCAAENITMRQLVEILKPLTQPGDKLPSRSIDFWLGSFIGRFFAFTQPPGAASYMKTHLGRTVRFDTSKIQREFGLTYRGTSATIAETVADLRAWKHLH